MSLQFATPGQVTLHYHSRAGAADARPVVCLNSLGTDLRIWDGVVAQLATMPILRLDMRGHGLSQTGAASIDRLARDVAELMDMVGCTAAILCGVSVGGMIAQALAVQRPDLVAGLVLCNTGATVGDADTWTARIAAVAQSGLDPMADAVLTRWFSGRFRADRPSELSGYRAMLTRTPAVGYTAVCAAIRDADLTQTARRIAVPTRCIAGTEDQATPVETVTALAELIPGAQLRVLQGVGHLPCVEAPGAVAREIKSLRAALQ